MRPSCSLGSRGIPRDVGDVTALRSDGSDDGVDAAEEGPCLRRGGCEGRLLEGEAGERLSGLVESKVGAPSEEGEVDDGADNRASVEPEGEFARDDEDEGEDDDPRDEEGEDELG